MITCFPGRGQTQVVGEYATTPSRASESMNCFTHRAVHDALKTRILSVRLRHQRGYGAKLPDLKNIF
jgi:hypothetical protein